MVFFTYILYYKYIFTLRWKRDAISGRIRNNQFDVFLEWNAAILGNYFYPNGIKLSPFLLYTVFRISCKDRNVLALNIGFTLLCCHETVNLAGVSLARARTSKPFFTHWLEFGRINNMWTTNLTHHFANP